jgi:lipopolysaccharide transport system ATP-binding protein
VTDLAICAEGLAKRYDLGKRSVGYSTLRETIMDAFCTPLQGKRRASGMSDETIWALRDVSFAIRRGEVVGIIGRNGAGKSTLLKILAQITEPTEGTVDIYGRVRSLLEVGTGFHPELSGGENIYLNGAILGMRKREIQDKFDEIVSFAEVEQFVDMPVKHYSSGMYMRLAFAVAAHLESEILLIDEALAVGDARFQRKCLKKMQEAGNEGTTVLFVSHNLPAVTRLCERAILIDEGRVSADGSTPQVIAKYLCNDLDTTAARVWTEPSRAPGGEVTRLCGVRIKTEEGMVSDTMDIRRPVGLEMEYEVLKSGYILLPFFNLCNESAVHVLELVDLDPAWRRRRRPAGKYVVTAWIPGNLLAEGMLFVSCGITTLEPRILQFNEQDVAAFQVIDSREGDSARGDWQGTFTSVVRPLLRWETQFDPIGIACRNPVCGVEELQR